MQTTMKQGLSVKDLVTVGIFTALFLVFALVGGIFFAPNPVLTFYMPVGSALLCGPVYLLLSLGGTGSYLVFFADPEGWASTMLGNGTEQSYIDTMRMTGTTGILLAMLLGTVLAAALSTFVGGRMLKKQFEKAGITK